LNPYAVVCSASGSTVQSGISHQTDGKREKVEYRIDAMSSELERIIHVSK
jgi:hypothetical protein